MENEATPQSNASFGSLGSAMQALQQQRQAQIVPDVKETTPVEEIGAELDTEEPHDTELEAAENPEEGELEAVEDEGIEPGDEESQVIVVDGQEYSEDEVAQVLKAHEESEFRVKDYTQKTQAVAAERRVLEKTDQVLQQMSQMYGKQVQEMDGLFKADLERFNGADWVKIARENPNEYHALNAEFQMAQTRYNQFQEGVKAHMGQVHEQQQQLRQQAAQQCAETLRSSIKGFNQDRYREMVGYAVEQGMPESIAVNSTEPALFKLINKAMAYDQARKIGGKKRVGQPKTLKTRRPAAEQQQRTEAANLVNKARKSGNMDDALAVYRARHKKGK